GEIRRGRDGYWVRHPAQHGAGLAQGAGSEATRRDLQHRGECGHLDRLPGTGGLIRIERAVVPGLVSRTAALAEPGVEPPAVDLAPRCKPASVAPSGLQL